MSRTSLFLTALAGPAIAVAGAGCDGAPGRPAAARSEGGAQIASFATLYAKSCAGCHGERGEGGAAVALADPVYLAIAGDDVLRRVVSRGVRGTPMPAFAKTEGGTLTGAEIARLVKGIRGWASPVAQASALPPYAAAAAGDAQRGGEVFRTFCASCHGADGAGGPRAGSVVDPAYLALVSDQYLRTVVIAGRPELGAPDWRDDVAGRPMTDREITDVVAWLAKQRTIAKGEER